MESPSFKKVRDLACDFVRKLPAELCDELYESLNRGVDVLDTEPSLQMYFYAFGDMHAAKLQYAFEHLRPGFIEEKEIEVVDYGCGQGLATLCFHDYLCNKGLHINVKKITLIEPSKLALSRAALLCAHFYPHTEIVTINKPFEVLVSEDLTNSETIMTLHLFSNVLDVDSFDINLFSQIVKSVSVGANEYIIVSPLISEQKVLRIRDFAEVLGVTPYYEAVLDKNELRPDKEWTCVVSLCASPLRKHSPLDDIDDIKEKAAYILREMVLDEEIRSEVFSQLIPKAFSGDIECQNLLAIFYRNGIGTVKDEHKAFTWFSVSAEKGSLQAIGNLAKCYIQGRGIKKDELAAFNLYTKLYNSNDIPSYHMLALCYLRGIGTEKNYEKAFSILNEACKEHDPKALLLLGVEYFEGKRIDKDKSKGISLIKSAAENGSVRAARILGQLYLKGISVKKDMTKAIDYLTIAGLRFEKKAISELIDIFRDKKYESLFGEKQYDVFVNAVHLGMPEVAKITITFLNTEPNAKQVGEVVYSEDGYRLIRTVSHYYMAGERN